MKKLFIEKELSDDKATDKQLTRWHGKKLSRGLLLDQLVAFGKKRKFRPALPKK